MLEICKASAGSGKTFTLTGKYLKILFQKYFEGNRSAYKNILAVTFTNKATDEMKQRILQELHQISVDPVSSPYFEDLKNDRDSAQLKDAAQRILYALLNDYSSFNISTIDKFFQKTLRSFAREIGQYSSYTVELDQNSVLTQAVDALMDSLEENPELLAWLISMSEDAVENGESWNVDAQVMGLASQIFSEEFKIKGREIQALLKDREAIDAYRKKLQELARNFEQKLKSLAQNGLDLIGSVGMSYDSFSYGKTSAFSYLEKLKKGQYELPGSRFIAAVGNVGKWVAKTADKETKAKVQGLYDGGLNDLITELDALMNAESEAYQDYVSAKVIVKDLFVLGLLHDISEGIQTFCRENNVVLLSETTGFLNKIIDGSDTPFVYERIGVRLENYMLDEFQDTSNMQWDNFRPLLKDSLDNGFEDLIVGDVKQSIYRWRNSDWRLLNSEIQRTFRGLCQENSLETNWRSQRRVIEFNNDFFTEAASQLQQIYRDNTGVTEDTSIESIYADVAQTVPEDRPDAGLVTLNIVDTKTAEMSLQEAVLPVLPSYIRALNQRGIEDRDIALLVQTNSEGAELARYLISKGFNVISEDSLYISSSPAVSRLVAQLRSLAVQGSDRMSELLFGDLKFEPEEKTLYNICEEAIRAMSETERSEVVFLQAFLDLVCDYVAKNTSDMGGFLKWWDDYGCKTSVSIPEGENALRIMTVHKSKGLGFKAVILPFFNFELYRERPGRAKILWCKPSRAPFDEFSLVPVRTGGLLMDSIFRQDYLDEIKYSYIDSMNAAYVAFTRAKEELIIFMQDRMSTAKNFSVKSISDLLCYKYLSNQEQEPAAISPENPVMESGEELPPCTSVYRFGCAGAMLDAATVPVENAAPELFYSAPIGSRLRLSFKGSEFLSEDNRSKGVLMHEILSNVATVEDLEKAVDESIAQGALEKDQRETVLEKLRRNILSVADRNWYAGENHILNEITIVDEYGQRHIPDRVVFSDGLVQVIDYKFGNLHSPQYVKQVSSYMSLIRSMGYENVKGFIWYFEEGLIEEC